MRSRLLAIPAAALSLLGAAMLLPAAAAAFSFSSPITSPAGSYPSSIAIGDLNGDGRLDLATVDLSPDQVAVLLGKGDGSFQAPVIYTWTDNGGTPHPGTPYAIAIGDLNGDGHPDLVTADGGSGDVSVLLNNGNGSFGAATQYPVGDDTHPGEPISVAIGNLNGDSHPDLATANVGSTFGGDGDGNVSVLPGIGDGSFGTFSQVIPSADAPHSVSIGDLNGDHHPDLVAASSDSAKVSVALGDGSGGFAFGSGAQMDFNTQTRNYTGLIANLNGGSDPDVVTAGRGPNLSVLLGNGNGTLGGFTDAPWADCGIGSICANAETLNLAAGDLNGDGKADLVTDAWDPQTDIPKSQVAVLLGKGDGSFQTDADFEAGEFPGPVAIGDLNGDGRPDIVTGLSTSGQVAALLNGVSSSPPSTGGGSTTSPKRRAPTTRITRAEVVSRLHLAVFLFKGDGVGRLRFQCKLDRARFRRCSSPAHYRRLKRGRHTFQVRAVDGRGRVDPTPAKRRFRIKG